MTARVRRLSDEEIVDLADWLRSRRYDIAEDAMWSYREAPAFLWQLGNDERLMVAMTEVRPGEPK